MTTRKKKYGFTKYYLGVNNHALSWAWWFTSVIPALKRLRQEAHEL
jgi:hypothetical protein